jgi:hypothetical protein
LCETAKPSQGHDLTPEEDEGSSDDDDGGGGTAHAITAA